MIEKLINFAKIYHLELINALIKAFFSHFINIPSNYQVFV
jgi:hypothetical protein